MIRPRFQAGRNINTPPPKEDEDIDNINEDTFGEAAMVDLEQEFDFKAMSFTDIRRGPLSLDPAIARFKGGKSNEKMVEEDDEEMLPPGILNSSPMDGRKVMTVEELEARFNRSNITLDSGINKWLPLKTSKPATISFPDEAEDDPLRGMMTRFEREGISRIHLRQLTTELPDLEDFYYKSYAKRNSRKTQTSENLLYLPLPTARKQRSDKDKDKEKEREKSASKTKETLANALGKVSSSSSKKPRQLLQLPTTDHILGNNNSVAEGDIHYSINNAIERIYKVVFEVEDALKHDSDTEYDLQLLQEKRKQAIKVIGAELYLDLSIDELNSQESKLVRFLNLLSMKKTKKILARSIRSIDSEALNDELFTRIIELFEYLDICRHDISQQEVDIFINNLIAAFVGYIGKSELGKIIPKIKILANKTNLPWIVCSKAGLVVSCLLFSRIEILKNDFPDQMDEWFNLAGTFFDQIMERLSEIFNSLNTDEFYGWQFMALLAMNIDADRKRQMVMELREKILMVAKVGDAKAVSDLNIFLNSLGLDASHLMANQ